MKKQLLHIILLVLFFSFNLYAQDDSEEETVSAPIFQEELLDEEKNYLTFKYSFIESLQYKAIENHKKALESLAICERVFPENVSRLFELAKNHFALNQYIEAHHYCDKALSIKSDDFWVLALSRDIFEKEKNYPEAIKIQKGLYSYKASAAGNLLKYYYRTKNIKEGKNLIEEIDKKYIYVLAIDFYRKYFFKVEEKQTLDTKKNNSPNKELSTLKKEFLNSNDYTILQEILEKEYQTQQFSNLLEDSDLGLSLFPTQAKLYLYKGLALNALGKHKKAVLVLESGLDYIFDNTILTKQLYNALIVGYEALKNSNKADYYRQMVQKL